MDALLVKVLGSMKDGASCKKTSQKEEKQREKETYLPQQDCHQNQQQTEVQKQTEETEECQEEKAMIQRKDLPESERQEQPLQMELKKAVETWVAKQQEQEDHRCHQPAQETVKEK